MPNVVPFRAIVVTIDASATWAAHSVSDLAAAIAMVRKNRWLADRKRAKATPSGPLSSVRCGSQARISRLVAAWVRTWTSSPIATACAASESTSSGPDRSRMRPITGAATSRRKTSRATEASLATPNQATSPGPCEIGAYPVVPPAWFSTTYNGAPGPSAVAIGTTTACSLAGASPISPAASKASACSRLSAQPSATAAARIERCSGSGASA